MTIFHKDCFCLTYIQFKYYITEFRIRIQNTFTILAMYLFISIKNIFIEYFSEKQGQNIQISSENQRNKRGFPISMDFTRIRFRVWSSRKNRIQIRPSRKTRNRIRPSKNHQDPDPDVKAKIWQYDILGKNNLTVNTETNF